MIIRSNTIFAVATGQVRAPIAVVRISGSYTQEVLREVAGSVPEPRRASLRRLRAPDGELLDRALVLWLPAPTSYTGEDSAELHLHGGRAVLRAVCDALREAGAAPAEPGEFTQRAFLNGRMDLLEAEGVADLIAAETDQQRRLALSQAEGAQSEMLAAWAERLRRALAWQEALIDFPDEDLPEETETALQSELVAIERTLRQVARMAHAAGRVRSGVKVAVIGRPNVGKSTLVNSLAGRDVAITSAIPGTTRDALEVWLELRGIQVVLIDTAGLRDSVDPLEAEGMRRARLAAAHADLVLHVVDASCPEASVPGLHVLRVANKIDLAPAPAGCIGVSAQTGFGMEALRVAMAAEVEAIAGAGLNVVFGHARHEAALLEAADALQSASAAREPELRGEDIRLALHALGRITGVVGVEDILDTIFGAFCIGK